MAHASDNNCEMFNGIYKELIGIIGLENTLKIFSHYAGNQISFPQRLYSRKYVEKMVLQEYDGTNIKELSQKYSYTQRWVSDKIKSHKLPQQTDSETSNHT